MEEIKKGGRLHMVREKGSSLRGKKTPSPIKSNCRGGAGGDNGNFHITWGPVISLSSMFPSAGKRESQGADNAEVTEIMMRMAFVILGNPRIIITWYPFPNPQSLLRTE